jgi:hypothetical protein
MNPYGWPKWSKWPKCDQNYRQSWRATWKSAKYEQKTH